MRHDFLPKQYDAGSLPDKRSLDTCTAALFSSSEQARPPARMLPVAAVFAFYPGSHETFLEGAFFDPVP
jgi:hypothetical protein